MKVSIEFNQVWMAKEHLYFNLSYKLINHLIFLFWLKTININFPDDF